MPARGMILLSWNRISDAMYQSLGIKRLRHECLKTNHLDFVTRYSVTVLKTKQVPVPNVPYSIKP